MDDVQTALANPSVASGNGDAHRRGMQILVNALTSWLRGAYGVGALSPPAVRERLTAAQNAYADMIEAANSNDRNAAFARYNDWAANSAAAIDMNRRRLEEYSNAFSSDVDLEIKMNNVAEIAASWQDQAIAQLAANPEHFTTFGRLFDQMMAQHNTLETSTGMLGQMIDQLKSALAKTNGVS